MNTCSKQQFLGGAMALTLSTVIVKIIGLVYKIPLMRCLGAEGMGYFNSAYELYTLFFVIATAGIPVAISIMISENIAAGRVKNAERIYKTSFYLLLFIGCVGSVVMCFGAHILANAINSPKSAQALILVSPTVFFVSASGAVRGFFQGHRNMIPTAVSQIIESLGKLVLGITFANIAKNFGLSSEKIAAYAILGLTVGTMISTAYLCVVKSREKLTFENRLLDNSCDKSGKISAKLVKLAIPVTVSSVLVSLTRIVDMFMLMNRLGDNADKISIYGSYSTMALPVYNLPSSLVAGIALALVPSITNAVNSRQKERENQLITSGIKLCAVISLPAALGIGVYSKQILGLLFAGENESIAIAAPLLSVLGASVFASCLVQVTNSVLQANGKIICPIKSMLAGVAVKAISSFVLIAVPQVGAMGAPLSTLFCNVTAVAVNLLYIGRFSSFDLSLSKILLKPMLVTTASVAASLGVYAVMMRLSLTDAVSFLIALMTCAIVYFVSVLMCGVLDAEEYQMLPFGTKIMSKISLKEKEIKNEQRRKNHRAFEKV